MIFIELNSLIEQTLDVERIEAENYNKAISQSAIKVWMRAMFVKINKY